MSADRPSTDFGQTLREARERKGVSLRQIANATKISVAVLEGLERNDISRLPGGIFGRAFVRAFASEVGLDPEATIQEFIAQFRSETVTAGHHSSPERFEDGEALESRRRTALTFLALIVLGLPIAAATVYFTLTGRRDASTVAPATVVAPQLPPAVDPPAPEADAPTPATAVQAPASVDNRRASAVAERIVVKLSVSRECWLSATVDGQRQLERVLRPGDQRTVEVFRDLVITAGDAGAVAMTINGAQAKPLGRSGEVVTARLDLTNFKSFLPSQ